MGWKFYVFVLLISGVISCKRGPAEINNDKEFVNQITQDSINQIGLTTTEVMNFEEERQESSFNLWKLIAIVSVVINFILFFFIRWLIRSERKNKRAQDRQHIKEKPFNSEEVYEPRSSTIIQKEVGPSEFRPSVPSIPAKTERISGEEDKKYEVELSLENSSSQSVEDKMVMEPKIFFAEKVSDTGVFTNVSERSDPHKSYFKLMVEKSNQEEAKYEVLDSEFILKQGSNAPDIYLYNACDPENSNQNFISEIVTIEQGIAQLVNGSWHIKQGHKAKIKFQ